MDVKKLMPEIQKLTEKISTAAVKRFAIAFLHLIFALILSRGVLFTRFSPFGVAYTAAVAGVKPKTRFMRLPRLNALAALLGAAVGYGTSDAVDGLKYICASLLCYAAGSIFAETRAMRYPAFMPMMAVFSLVATNAIYLIAGAANPLDVLMFLIETVLVGAGTWFYLFPVRCMPQLESTLSPTDVSDADVSFVDGTRYVHAKLGNWEIIGRTQTAPLTICEKVSVLVLAATFCIALTGWDLPFGMNAGRIAALILSLGVSSGSSGTASGVGLCIGLALDLCGNGLPLNAASLGLSALFAGLFRRFGALTRTAAFVIGFAATLPWLYTDTVVNFLYESFFASVVYYLFYSHIDRCFARLIAVPEPKMYLEERKVYTSSGNETAADTGYIRRKLGLLGVAFRNLCDTLVPGVEETGTGEDPALMFEAAAMRVCKKCSNSHVCWNGSDSVTHTALNDATPAIRARGRAKTSDFPPYFAARCIHFPEFLTAVNEAIAVSAYRHRFKRRIYEDVRLLCAQYEGVNGAIRDMAADLSDAPRVDRRLCSCLTQELRKLWPKADFTLTALTGQGGRLSVEIECNDPTELNGILPEFLPVITEITGKCMTITTTVAAGADLARVILAQRETYRGRIGAALRSRYGELRSGDTCIHFKTDDGKLYLILSDGMGSGEEAAEVSRSVVELLESFLRSGVSVETALRLVCPALALKNRSETFTTIDIFCVDLFAGHGTFYKCGAAPSFVLSPKEDGQIRRITSSALPAGLFPGDALSADKTTVSVHDGDTVVMVSDGIADSINDASLLRALSEYRDCTPAELARRVLESFPDQEGNDDMTVFVVRITTVENS